MTCAREVPEKAAMPPGRSELKRTLVGAGAPGTAVTVAVEPSLPAEIQSYLARALPPRSPTPRRVRITQVGEMIQKPGGRPLRFRAGQELAVAEVRFLWRARFPVARVLWLDVVDRYSAAGGRLDARLCGVVPVLRSSGPATTKSQAMRYLAELPWVPHAMAANAELEWRQLEGGSVEVATRAGGQRVAVRLEFDAAGDIVRTSAPDRPRTVRGGSVETPWGGLFFDHEFVGGVRVPTRAEVRWELPDGPFAYWRGTVTSFEVD